VKFVDYTDEHGRLYRVKLPDDVPDEQAELGIPVGPPDVVDELGLPEPFATRLHNELHNRSLWNHREIRRRPGALQGALQAALRTDFQMLSQAYYEFENPQPLEEQGG
jgi:hypothetical protein